jgi:hypothetical protein
MPAPLDGPEEIAAIPAWLEYAPRWARCGCDAAGILALYVACVGGSERR